MCIYIYTSIYIYIYIYIKNATTNTTGPGEGGIQVQSETFLCKAQGVPDLRIAGLFLKLSVPFDIVSPRSPGPRQRSRRTPVVLNRWTSRPLRPLSLRLFRHLVALRFFIVFSMPFWMPLGSIFPPNLPPKIHQNPLKLNAKMPSHIYFIF